MLKQLLCQHFTFYRPCPSKGQIFRGMVNQNNWVIDRQMRRFQGQPFTEGRTESERVAPSKTIGQWKKFPQLLIIESCANVRRALISLKRLPYIAPSVKPPCRSERGFS